MGIGRGREQNARHSRTIARAGSLVSEFSTGRFDIGDLELWGHLMPEETPYIKGRAKFKAQPRCLNI